MIYCWSEMPIYTAELKDFEANMFSLKFLALIIGKVKVKHFLSNMSGIKWTSFQDKHFPNKKTDLEFKPVVLFIESAI